MRQIVTDATAPDGRRLIIRTEIDEKLMSQAEQEPALYGVLALHGHQINGPTAAVLTILDEARKAALELS